eukprot:1240491-Pyramimonas_sp.AAC.1
MSTGVASHRDQNEILPPFGGLRTARAINLSPLSWAPGRSIGVASHADQNEISPSLGVCDQRSCRYFRGLLGGPAE